jgi:hypothetical protein
LWEYQGENVDHELAGFAHKLELADFAFI